MKHFHVIFAFLFLFQSSFAQEVKVRSKADSTEITIGDQINFDVYVDAPSGTPITFPRFADTLTSKIELVESSLIDTSKTESGDLTYHQRLVLTSFDTGYMVIPPLLFMVNGDTSNLVATEAQLIYVYDIEVDLQQDIKDIKDPQDVPFNWMKYIWWGVAALVLVLLVAAIIIYFVRKKKGKTFLTREKPKRPAHEIALAELEKIRQQQLWQNDRIKEHHSAVTDVLRQYIEDRFELPALEQTSYEIMESLRTVNLSDEMRKRVKDILTMADLVKFAKAKPVGAENEACMITATDFVKETLIMPLDQEGSSETENQMNDVG